MQVHEEDYRQENREEVDKVNREQRLGSNPNPTNSCLGSEMMRKMLKEEEETNKRTRSSSDMWVERGENLLDVKEDEDDSLFYDGFPSLPDIHCFSSSPSSSMSACSSSSSSCSAPYSSTNSWAMIKAENEDGVVGKQQPRETTANQMIPYPPEHQQTEGIDALEELGGMDLLESSSIWDTSSIFPCDTDEEENNNDQHQRQEGKKRRSFIQEEGEEPPSEDLAMVFFEWLKSNKESISPEDLRNIKLKRSTIECAARRLGGGKEGMTQLLKLILAWVQNHYLRKRKNREDVAYDHQYHQQQQKHQHQHQQQQTFPIQGPPTNNIFPTAADCNNPSYPSTNSWFPQFPYIVDPSSPSSFPPLPHMGYMGDGVFSGQIETHYPFSPPSDFNLMVDFTPSWPPPPFHYNTFPDSYGGGGQMFHGSREKLEKMASSATKEARKKRMARQRRFFHNHHRHFKNQHQQHHLPMEQQIPHSSRPPINANNCITNTPYNDSSNCVLWSSSLPSSSSSSFDATFLSLNNIPSLCTDSIAMHGHHERQNSSDRHQDGKTENLKLLLQKVLKQSDVSSLGRIVLPKKEAETYLPELEARDGIPLAMEDIGTSRIWNMRYRFWPNNKSRMYLLENTGDFVRSNGLQEGDYIVIYSDSKFSKYMIRGMKVQKAEVKAEARNPGKMQTNPSDDETGTVDGSSSSLSIIETETP